MRLVILAILQTFPVSIFQALQSSPPLCWLWALQNEAHTTINQILKTLICSPPFYFNFLSSLPIFEVTLLKLAMSTQFSTEMFSVL